MKPSGYPVAEAVLVLHDRTFGGQRLLARFLCVSGIVLLPLHVGLSEINLMG